METFQAYLEENVDPLHRGRVKEVLDWVSDRFPGLERAVKWNQPMFLDHGTYIIGFSVAKHHLAVAPEKAALDRFEKEIEAAGYQRSQQLIRIPWQAPVAYDLLEKIIAYNIRDKAAFDRFWREPTR